MIATLIVQRNRVRNVARCGGLLIVSCHSCDDPSQLYRSRCNTADYWRSDKLVYPFSLKCGIVVVRIAIPRSHRPLCCRLREAGQSHRRTSEHESEAGTPPRTSFVDPRVSRAGLSASFFICIGRAVPFPCPFPFASRLLWRPCLLVPDQLGRHESSIWISHLPPSTLACTSSLSRPSSRPSLVPWRAHGDG